MDVALDANEFLSDPCMQSVRFQTLFAYLRKTQSRLLIPKIVWDEVIARYPERVSGPHTKAANDVKILRSLLLATKVPEIGELEMEREVSALRRKMRKPSPYVRALILDNFSDVSVEEIARRGIGRIPPANPKGEELRDVMIWLMMLGHAKKSDQDVAFISHDEHFRENDDLHPKLRDDLEGGKIKLHFYKGIDDFIKAHAPSPRNLTEEEAFRLRGRQVVLDTFEIETRRFFPRYWGSETEVDITDRKIQFVRAALYDVGGGSQFGEMEILATLQATLSRPDHQSNMNVISNYSPDITFGKGLGFSSASVKPAAENWQSLVWGTITPTAEITSLGMAEPLDWKDSSFKFGTPVPTFYTPPKRRSKGVLSGKMTISFRVVSGRVTKVEVESLEITEIQNRAPSWGDAED
jgi:PIN domain